MAKLKSIIGSILRDIINAQHEANLYSYALSDSYGKEGKVKDFQLPGVVISDMEMELKYGVTDLIESTQESNINFARLNSFITELCNKMSGTIITTAIKEIDSKITDHNDKGAQFIQKLKGDTYDGTRIAFERFLSRCCKHAFNGKLFKIVNKETGMIRIEKVEEKFEKVIRDKFINDSDLDNMFTSIGGEKFRNKVVENVMLAVRGIVLAEANNDNFKRTKTFPQLDVSVTTDELSRLPEEAIHTFKLKFSPTTCNVNAQYDEEELSNFDMNT